LQESWKEFAGFLMEHCTNFRRFRGVGGSLFSILKREVLWEIQHPHPLNRRMTDMNMLTMRFALPAIVILTLIVLAIIALATQPHVHAYNWPG
jgi:hypothetical protein